MMRLVLKRFMNDPITGQLALPGYRFDDGRNHWRNPIWLIPSTREPEIRTFRTRLAKPECRRHRPIAAEAAICLARCFWLRSSFWATSSTAMAAEPILPLHLRRHRRHRASLQRRLRLPRPTRQRKIRHQKKARTRGPFYNGRNAADYIWIGLAKVASADSRTASDMVGWAWQVRARSSDDPPNSISTASSWIISPAL